MKYIVSALIALSAMPAGAAHAGDVAALARANCVKAIMSSSAQVTRGMVAKFQFAKNGAGYEMTGYDENHQGVSCKTAADGHVTWIVGG